MAMKKLQKSDEETEEIEEQDGLKRIETEPNPVDVANVYP